MKLSIIIPCFNVALYIDKLLNILIEQSQNYNIEIVTINDGSSDNTLSILNKYFTICNKIKVINQEKNMGVIYTRNTGLSHALGDYIWFIDGDDSIANNAIKIIFEELNNKDYDVLNIGINEILADKIIKTYSFHSSIYTGQEAFANYHIPAYQVIRIIKRSFIVQHNIKYELIPEDEDFLLSVHRYAQSYKFIPNPLYYYIKRNNSHSKNTIIHAEYYNGYFKILNKYSKNNKDMSTSFMEAIVYLCIRNIVLNYNRVKEKDKNLIKEGRISYYKKLKHHIKEPLKLIPFYTKKGLICHLVYYLPCFADMIVYIINKLKK